jgi:hypothetical protein
MSQKWHWLVYLSKQLECLLRMWPQKILFLPRHSLSWYWDWSGNFQLHKGCMSLKLNIHRQSNWLPYSGIPQLTSFQHCPFLVRIKCEVQNSNRLLASRLGLSQESFQLRGPDYQVVIDTARCHHLRWPKSKLAVFQHFDLPERLVEVAQ